MTAPSPQPFATVNELQDRLDWVLTDDETRAAIGALEDASDLARGYGREWMDAEHAPRLVRTLVLQAVARFMRNPDGYTQSRAGDETLAWSDTGREGGSVTFTDDEIKLLAGLAGRSTGLLSVPVTAWGPQRRRDQGYVPVQGGGKQFPLFSLDGSDW